MYLTYFSYVLENKLYKQKTKTKTQQVININNMFDVGSIKMQNSRTRCAEE